MLVFLGAKSATFQFEDVCEEYGCGLLWGGGRGHLCLLRRGGGGGILSCLSAIQSLLKYGEIVVL